MREPCSNLCGCPNAAPSISKVELSDGLIEYAVRELSREAGREAVERRIIIHFVVERITNPIVNESWR